MMNFLKKFKSGAPAVAQWDGPPLGIAGTWVQSSVWHSRLRIGCCHSCSLVWGCGSDLIPGPGAPCATGWTKKKKNQIRPLPCTKPQVPSKPGSWGRRGLWESNVYQTLGNLLSFALQGGLLTEEQKEILKEALHQPRCLKNWKHIGSPSPKSPKNSWTWKAVFTGFL